MTIEKPKRKLKNDQIWESLTLLVKVDLKDIDDESDEDKRQCMRNDVQSHEEIVLDDITDTLFAGTEDEEFNGDENNETAADVELDLQGLADTSNNDEEREDTINGSSNNKIGSAVFNATLFGNRKIKNISKAKANPVTVQDIFKVGEDILKKRNLKVTRERATARDERERKMKHDALIDYSNQTDDSMFTVAFKKLQKIMKDNK
mmetsp:Transcript_9462/g.11018  ORF Transcript_9462/g.11018 Transcript_9462/m.11018 type:complete len:205 (-) Transcript_9462:13-627(-)